MPETFHKSKPILSLTDFLAKAKKVTTFSSSTGKRYKVTKIENDVMFFKRIDADGDLDWSFDLNCIYLAYSELEDFATVNFKPYVPIRHSPARGILIHLGMIK